MNAGAGSQQIDLPSACAIVMGSALSIDLID
jgi:hypothetical protein